MEKVIRDGKVAVLYSPGFGAGWFSWNSDCPQCLFHPKIVEWVEGGKRDELSDLEKLFGTGYFYAGGASDLEIEWLPIGTPFKIDEYDGCESVVVSGQVDWMFA